MNKLNFKYETLTPFKICVLENFPFLEADFDALTNYQIMCKLAEYINKVAQNQNLLQENIKELNNWFNNLDVQDEIDNKLDEMAQSGQLTEIVTQYLQISGILAFNTISDMKASDNLINGSFAKTYGANTLLDGYGRFYKIRTIENTDIVDNVNIIALNNPNLIAELVPEKPVKHKYIFIGDSYGELENQNTWIDVLIDKLELTENDYYRKTLGSTGFGNYNASTNKRFINLLEDIANNLSNNEKNSITDIFVCGGANDTIYSVEALEPYIESFMTYAKQTFPNAKVYVGEIGFTMNPTNKNNMVNVITSYNNVTKYGGCYLKGCENAIHYYPYFIKNGIYPVSDQVHPNQDGSTKIGEAVYEAYTRGYASITRPYEVNITDRNFNGIYSSQNNDMYILTITKELDIPFTTTEFIARPSNPIDICDIDVKVIGGFENGKNYKPCRALLRTNTEDVYIDGWLKIESYINVSQIRTKLVFYPNVYDSVSGNGVGGYKKFNNTNYLILVPQTFIYTTYEC